MGVKHFSALILAVALSGCGGAGTEDPSSRTADVRVRSADGPAMRTGLRARLTPAVLEKLGEPVLYTRLLAQGTEAGLLAAGRNGDVTTWLSQDKIALALRDGLVISTRGLGADLMSADVAEPLEALRGARRRAVRIHRYIDGERQLVPRSFVCSYTARAPSHGERAGGRVVVEHCKSVGLAFENRYWMTAGGAIWKSRQWLGPDTGHIALELLDP